jgi:hypothetical protein
MEYILAIIEFFFEGTITREIHYPVLVQQFPLGIAAERYSKALVKVSKNLNTAIHNYLQTQGETSSSQKNQKY